MMNTTVYERNDNGYSLVLGVVCGAELFLVNTCFEYKMMHRFI